MEDQTSNLEDLELLQACSREDLFMLIREDPEYYLQLIKKHQLEHPLSILISRSDDGGGLNLKFRIYPEDRWVEVGYWGGSTDQEVYQDFVTQIDLLLQRSRGGKSSLPDRPHLASQLDGNNNPLSPDYGRDIKGNFREFNFKPEQSLSSTTTMGIQQQQTKEIPSTHRSRLAPENLKETLNSPAEEIEQKPVEFLNKFVAQLLERIIEKIPQLIEINPDQNYQLLINQLSDQIPDSQIPTEYQPLHQQLLERIKGHQYLQQVQQLTSGWTSNYPELNDTLISFHRQAMRLNPSPYTNISSEKLSTLLDQEDQTILDQYCLDIRDIWLDYLDHQD